MPADFGPLSTTRRVDAVAAELGAVVAEATDAGMAHQAAEAGKLTAQAAAEAPRRAEQAQHGGS